MWQSSRTSAPLFRPEVHVRIQNLSVFLLSDVFIIYLPMISQSECTFGKVQLLIGSNKLHEPKTPKKLKIQISGTHQKDFSKAEKEIEIESKEDVKTGRRKSFYPTLHSSSSLSKTKKKKNTKRTLKRTKNKTVLSKEYNTDSLIPTPSVHSSFSASSIHVDQETSSRKP